MILILSSDQDYSTDRVCDWLDRKGARYFRLHPVKVLNAIKQLGIAFDSESRIISFDSFELNLDEVRVVWNRKWHYSPRVDRRDESVHQTNKNNINSVSKSEFNDLSNFIFYLLRKANWMDHPDSSRINKLLQLELARKAGLLFPQTLITSSKEALLLFRAKHSNVITKPIGTGTVLFLNEERYLSYTSNLMQDDFDKLPESFNASLFQEQIEKDFEVRTFFLEQKIYSMAIFSQNDDQTTVDFRKYGDCSGVYSRERDEWMKAEV